MAEAFSAINCPVCSEELTNPKLLQCNHVVCGKCIVDWLRKAGRGAGCPLCRAPILPPTSSSSPSSSPHQDDLETLVEALPTELTMVAKVESSRVLSSRHVCMYCDDNTAATAFCLQCHMKLCRPCAKSHKKFPAMKTHVVEDLDDLTPEQLVSVNRTRCKNHHDDDGGGGDSLAEAYCSTHQDLICLHCAVSKHRACAEVKPIKMAATDKREHFRREAQRLREKEAAIKTRIRQTRDKLSDNRGAADRAFEELQQCVERRHQHFMQLIQAQEDSAQLTRLEGIRAAVSSQAGVLDSLVGSSPDDALLGSERTMLTRLAQLASQAALMDTVQEPATITPDPRTLTQLKSAIAALGQVQDKTEGGIGNKVAVVTTHPTRSRDSFTTPSGIKVLVYKTDITKLPVDAIVNNANEELFHGAGVAYAISKAAGFGLKDEGRRHIEKHGRLRVTEVVETTAGKLLCKKVLHAVGPRWYNYTDKTLCRQRLVDTVFNCLQKADTLGFTSVALPSISAAIFGVPQDVCADSYLSAVKAFDELHGRSTTVRDVHFVDVNDAMISTIQDTFSARWTAPASNTSQAGHTTAAGGGMRQETTGSAQNLAEHVHERPGTGTSRNQKQDQAEVGRDNKESDQTSISHPNSPLVTGGQPKVPELRKSDRKVGRKKAEIISVDPFANRTLLGCFANSPRQKQAEEKEKTPPAEADSSAGWSRNLGQMEVEALRFLLGAQFDQTLDVKENRGRYLLTFRGAPSKALENWVDSLRREDVELTPEEISKLGDTVDVRSEGIEAFVKIIPSHDKAAVFALDYTAMTRAKHQVTAKAGKVKVTSRRRRRFDVGTP